MRIFNSAFAVIHLFSFCALSKAYFHSALCRHKIFSLCVLSYYAYFHATLCHNMPIFISALSNMLIFILRPAPWISIHRYYPWTGGDTLSKIG
jgi:hypothetical protein